MVDRRQAGSGLIRRRGSAGSVAPMLVSLGTASGTEVGGTSVTLSGAGFNGVTSVLFGGVAATSVVVVNDSTITCVTPAISNSTTFPSRAVLGDYRDHALSSTAADNAMNVSVTKGGVTSTLVGAYSYTSELARIFTTDLAWESRVADPRIALNGSTVSGHPNYAAVESATQGTASKQPAFAATGEHGGPCMTGDGTDDELLVTLATPVASGSRCYDVYVGRYIATGTNKSAGAMIAAGNVDYCIQYSGAAFWTQSRNDTVGDSPTTSAVAVDTVVHTLENGFTVGGTASLAVDGVTADNSVSTGTLGANLTKLSFFSANPVVGLYGNYRLLHRVTLKRIPTAGELTSMRAFLNGAFFPGYTGLTYK